MAKRERNRTRAQIIRRRILILAVVAAVPLCLLAGWRLFVRRPSLPAAVTPDPAAQGADPGSLLTGDRKKDFFTFLVVGRDSGGGGNTDTIMVVAYDIPGQTVHILNIYRDTMVNVSWDIKRINSVYNALGMDGLKEHVGKLIGFTPDYCIKIELEAFGELVDAIGGVDFEIPNNMNYNDPTQNLHIRFEKGWQHLDGNDAMKVIRWRKNNDGSGISVGDIGRVQIQQDFLKALAGQCLKIGNLTKVGDFARIFSNNVDSDLSLGELIWFGQQALGLDTDNFTFHTLPGDYNGSAWSRTYQTYQSYVLPSAGEIADLISAYFNPYHSDVTADMLDIMSVNRDGSLSASGGVVADKTAGKPPAKPAPKPQETAGPVSGEAPPLEEIPEPEESVQPVPAEATPPAQTPMPEPEAGPDSLPQPSYQLLPAMPLPAGN